MELEILDEELWYGALTHLGTSMPFDRNTVMDLDLSVNTTPNQGMPFLISNHGRWIWLSRPYHIAFCSGRISFPEGSDTGKAGTTLRDAYMYMNRTYLPHADCMPDKRLFKAPIFNTWIEFTFNQDERNTLQYARDIMENGFEPGVLMIDDSWAESYGDWRFHSGRFPDPEGMVRKLHEMGFAVMLWICPYITPDTPRFREARDRKLLLTTEEGKPFLCSWWNGYSAALDLENSEALSWLKEQMDRLTEIGIDGFKFDGADPFHYVGAFHCGNPADPNDNARCWAEFASRWKMNEMRASWKAAGLPDMQRLSDKNHSWADDGIGALVPDALALGITGHPYSCPDMIGGGEYVDFEANSDNLDPEIFIRHAAAAALMPAIQFSAAPWRILSGKDMKRLSKLLEIRKKNMPRILELLEEAREGNEPVVRYMEYEFPRSGYGRITDQFMLGNDILVAPVLEKGRTDRQVVIPPGWWMFRRRKLEGGRTIELDGGDMPLIVLERYRG